MIKELLDTRIRPAVQDDGGDIEYVGYNADTGVVQVRLQVMFIKLLLKWCREWSIWQGACSTCSSSKVCSDARSFSVSSGSFRDLQLTLKGGVESMLLHYCPEVKSVEEVVNSEIEEVN